MKEYMIQKQFTNICRRFLIGKLFLFLLLYSIVISGCNGQPGASLNDEFYALPVGDTIVNVEIVDTPDERRVGLMFRESMPDDHGMLFVFEHERVLSFWMKNTRIPLSLAYITKDGTIAHIVHMEPYDQRSHTSNCAVQYALEVNQGWFKEHGVEVGDKVELPDKTTMMEK